MMFLMNIVEILLGWFHLEKSYFTLSAVKDKHSISTNRPFHVIHSEPSRLDNTVTALLVLLILQLGTPGIRSVRLSLTNPVPSLN